MTTIDLKLATETVLNLNAALAITGGVASPTSGTYALINDIISNLVSIKSSLISQEKLLYAAINTEVTAGATATDGNLTFTASTLRCSAGLGSDVTARYTATQAAVTGETPAMLVTGTNKYSESVVFTLLAECGGLIDKLKNSTIVDATFANNGGHSGDITLA